MMNKWIWYGLLAAVAALSATGNADVIRVFHPQDADLYDLPHGKYLTWGIDFTLSPNEKITAAELKYTNIWDWTTEKNDHLYTSLLDNPRCGVRSYTDGEGSGDYFSGTGIPIGDWSDLYGGRPHNFDLVYDMAALGLLEVLEACAVTTPTAGMANFGFGIDPDCHFYNSGVTFTITTETVTDTNPIPEPASALLLALGALLLRRRNT